METKKEVTNDIYKISKLILKFTDEDYEKIQNIIDGQKGYIHPFKCETQARQHELGDYNQKVVDAIKTLHEVLKHPPEFVKRS